MSSEIRCKISAFVPQALEHIDEAKKLLANADAITDETFQNCSLQLDMDIAILEKHIETWNSLLAMLSNDALIAEEALMDSYRPENINIFELFCDLNDVKTDIDIAIKNRNGFFEKIEPRTNLGKVIGVGKNNATQKNTHLKVENEPNGSIKVHLPLPPLPESIAQMV